MVSAQIVTGTGPGSNATVRVIETNGTDRSFLAYPVGFGGGTTVALGDINGDGVADIITGAGPSGGPHVRVWNGVDFTEIGGFFAYDPAFPGGVSVAAGDVNGDGQIDIITGAGPGGGPHVRVWDGATFAEIGGFYAYDPAFPGGVEVAAGDVNGDGRADIITGAGPGGGPYVRVWSGADFTEIGGFYAYHPLFAGGVHVAAGDVNGDGLADIITGAGPGGGPHVRVWNGATFAEFGGFFPYDPSFPGGVKVAALDLTYDGRVEILTVPGPGAGPLVAIWTSDDFSLMGAYFAYDPAFTGGVSIASPAGSSPVRFTSATAATFSVATPGSFTVTTVGGGVVPTLTVTGALPAGVTFADNGDRTATLAGTPTGPGGTFPLTLTATSGSGTPVTQTFTLTINQAPAITSAAATTFGLGGAGTFTVTTTGFPTPTLSSTGALPAGVTFTPNADGTATLAGTPAPGSGGVYPLLITATNGVSPDATQAFVLTVNSSPAFTSANATTFTVGSAGTFAITTTATPAVTSITRTGTLPAGVTFTDNGNGTATLSGTPAATSGGTYPLTLTASNGVGTNAVQTFTLTVRQAPAITSAAATTFVVGAAGFFTVTTTGFPTSALTLTGALPSGVLFTDNLDGTATLAGTPDAGTGGSYPLSITAANGVGSNAVQAFTLTVNQAPAFTSANATTFTVGSAGTFTVTTSGVPGVTSIARTGAALPTGVTYVDNGNGTATLAGTAAVGTGGVYNFVFTINNGVGGNVTQNFALTITEAPAFTSAASTTFTVGSAGTFTVTTTAEPDVTLITLGGVALPTGVTFVSNGNGTATLSGTPGAGTGGTYALTFTANNGIGGNVVQNFTLTVNQAPAFTSANTTTFIVGSAGTFSITTSGVPAVTTITRSAVALPGGVTFVDNGNGTGTLSGTPLSGSSGAYVFTFTATNGVTPDAVQTFTLNVHEPPAITSANTDTFVVGTADSFTVTTTGFPTPTVSQTGALPTGVTFTPATRVLGGTATQTGAFPLQFTAANGVGTGAAQNFTLNVVCPAITVSALSLPDGLYQTAYGPVDFNQSGSTGSTFTWTASGLPAGITIDISSGIVSGTANNTSLLSPVVVTVTDNFGCQATRNVTITLRPTTDNETYVGGVGNTQYVVAASGPSTPHVLFNDNVKTGDNGPGALFITFGSPANGTVVEGATDGTFTYTPNVNFAGPTDSFTYTLEDSNGVTNTGLVTINLSGLVWYVNSSGGNGDGRSHSPFNNLDSAETASGAGQIIYVHAGAATTPGTLDLKANQTLWGAGATFTLNALSIPAATNPTLISTLGLANGVLVNSLSLNVTGPSVISGVALTGIETINAVTILGGNNSGFNLVNMGGTLNVTASSLTGVVGSEVRILGGTGTINMGATIVNTVGGSVDVQNRTGGTVTFSGAISDTGTSGVVVGGNTGSTIAFTGGLALSTGASAAFAATGGGTVIVTQNNTTIVNTITTTTGVALNVANTNIGASGLTFRSISANGASNGIILSNTGAAGGLTVTGNGGLCTPGTPTCTGGRIQNTFGGDNSTATPFGTGIVLNNTRAVSLTRMRLDNHSNYAIRGTSVDGFVFDNGLVDGVNGTNQSTPFSDGSFVFFGVTGVSSGMTGTSAITNSTIQGGYQRNVAIDNSVGTLNLTVSGTTIRRTSDLAGDDGFFLEADTTANVAVALTNNTFARHGGDHINISLVNNAVLDLTIAGNTLHGNYAGTPEGNHPIGLGQGILVFGASFDGTLTYVVSNNGSLAVPFRGNAQGGAIHVNKGSGTGTFSGSIENNVIGDPAIIGSGSSQAFGIIASARGAGGSHTTLINNNLVRQYLDRGIVLEAGEGSAALNATVTNNTVSDFAHAINSLHGMDFNMGILTTDTNTACLAISGNSVGTAGNEPSGGADIRLRRRFGATVRLPGVGGTTNAAATTLLQTNNPTATTILVTGDGYSSGAACQIP